MRRRNKNRLGISATIDKGTEINNSLTTYYVSIILFGLFTLATLPAALLAPGMYNIFLFSLTGFVCIQSIKGMKRLKTFKREFEENPEKLAKSPVPKPILYQAVFWYLPK